MCRFGSVSEIEERIKQVDDEMKGLQRLRIDLLKHLDKAKKLEQQKEDLLNCDQSDSDDHKNFVESIAETLFDSSSQTFEDTSTYDALHDCYFLLQAMFCISSLALK